MTTRPLISAPLGQTPVEAYCPGKRKTWQKGILVGRTREENPKFDVMLADRSIMSGLPEQQVRVISMD